MSLQSPACLGHPVLLSAQALLLGLVCLEALCSPVSPGHHLVQLGQVYLEVLKVHVVQSLPLVQVLQQSHCHLWAQLGQVGQASLLSLQPLANLDPPSRPGGPLSHPVHRDQADHSPQGYT